MERTRFEALHAETWRDILGYALRRTGNPEDAADVVAEVFMVAWRRRADVPAGPAARPWLYGVARLVLANQRRGDLRRGLLATALRDAVRSAPPDPATVALARHDAQTVRAGLRALPEIDRELLTLTAWDGLSPAEAAAALGLNAVTARVRLHRARNRLRKLLQQPEGSGHVRSDGRSPVPVEETS
ncbi:RNA polymerase sigma factor [Paractinoplanes toevensis]|uniref:Uncharacterized protein n=1 Tax=Paractinoplanes toevensis TaxID=571911 RepID=A0A919W4Y4_9ACTN|nr:sigma-70 family RNA polymerase sigma factor [Actinoplanes toevensis]GIM90648.1 hypothetical protein Ato02nite_024410 [Actinoplanes toevensis]